MIAKINKGISLYGAVSYNQNKVTEGTARVISSSRMICEMSGDPEQVMQKTLLSFENYLIANKRTERPIVHISLNPDPGDTLTDTQFAQLAKDYMEQMNYGNQPYIVYVHEDIDRRHIHIVSTCVDETGKKIDDSYEHRRSMTACRELESKYGLKSVMQEKSNENAVYLKKVDAEKGDVKTQIRNILKSVATSYHYHTFGEYNALLSCFNIEAKTVKGEHKGLPYNGLVYCAVDNKGEIVGTPLKSSILGRSYGYQALEKRMSKSAENFKVGKISPKIKGVVAEAMRSSLTINELSNKLKTKGIDVVFRQNKDNRIYGVTFIDHNEQAVFNGSRLGKEFSANVFNSLFNEQAEGKTKSHFEDIPFSNQTHSDERSFGLFSLEQHGVDPEEEEFARLMSKKKKKKRNGYKL